MIHAHRVRSIKQHLMEEHDDVSEDSNSDWYREAATNYGLVLRAIAVEVDLHRMAEHVVIQDLLCDCRSHSHNF